MKHIIAAGFTTLIISLLISCSKDADTAAVLSGKWNIVYDSSYAGVGFNNHPVNYIGKAGDYFDFRNDGKLYTKENEVLDTLGYQLISVNEIIIDKFGLIANGVPETNNITNLTKYGVTISAPASITPGGIFGRKVNLKR